MEGLTRDVSASGILFSVAGDPPEVGEPVWVMLSNPVTGESLEVPGVVARQLQGEAGDVPAPGVRFRQPPTGGRRAQGFLARPQESGAARPPGWGPGPTG